MKPYPLIPDPSPEMVETAKELKKVVGKYYTVLESSFDEKGYYFTVILDKKEHPEAFEELRLRLKGKRYFPRIVNREGEWIIAIFPYPERPRFSVKVNIILLGLTIFTTFWAGAILWDGYMGVEVGFFHFIKHPSSFLWGGITFGLPLMAILGTHEMGHYITSKKYNVDASLHFFIPIPPFIAPFGTFGALISMRESIPNRRALVEIGAAGPIAGFLVALPVILIGLKLSTRTLSPEELAGDHIIINFPIIFHMFLYAIPLKSNTALHPTAIAGWIGVFVTALNLLPIGQLDGGHIVRGIFGESAKYISMGFIAILFILSFVTHFYSYTLFIFFIFFFGLIHPPPLDDISPLKKRQRLVALTALALFVISFHPAPISFVHIEPPVKSLEIETENNVTYLLPGEIEEIPILLRNDGNEVLNLRLDMSAHLRNGSGEEVWATGYKLNLSGVNITLNADNGEISLDRGEEKAVKVHIEVPAEDLFGTYCYIRINVSDKDGGLMGVEELHLLISPIRMKTSQKEFKVFPGTGVRFNLTISNVVRWDVTAEINVSAPNTTIDIENNTIVLHPGETKDIVITVFTDRVWMGEKITVFIAARGNNSAVIGILFVDLLSI